MRQITKSRYPRQIRFDDTLISQVERFAKKNKVNFSEAVREILARGLGMIKPEPTDPKFMKSYIELKLEVEEILRYLRDALNNPAILLFYAEMFVFYLQEFAHPKVILDDFKALENWYKKRVEKKAKLQQKHKKELWRKNYDTRTN